MAALESLSKPWVCLSLSAPEFVWFAAFLIVTFTVAEGIRLYLTVRREGKLYQGTSRSIEQLLASHRPKPQGGLSEEGYEALRFELENQPKLRSFWRNYLDQLICERSVDGRDSYWSEGSAAAASAISGGLGASINWKWFGAVPGFVTGLGLLVTFVAILFALADLHADSTGQIHGISQLLEGLAGKFISSVAALISASMFLPLERRLLHGAEQTRQGLIDTLDAFVPRLTPARILISLKRDSAEQADALRDMLTSLGPRLRQGLSESISPTLDRMVVAIEELNQVIRAAEAQRRDALTDALQNTLNQLTEGLQKSLASLGEGFSQTLVGEAGRSFDRVLASLESTSRLVERMNAQFEENQGAIKALIVQAQDSAGRQMELGKTQVEELSAVLRELMGHLSEAANSSVAQMNGALSDAITRSAAASQESAQQVAKLVGNLAAQFETSNAAVLTRTKDDLNLVTDQIIGKVEKFSDQIAEAVGRNAQATHASVSKVLEETNAMSRQNAERIASVLERNQQQLERTQILGGQLNQLAEQLRAALPEYSSVTKALQAVASETNLAAQRSKDAASSIDEVAKSLRFVQAQVSDLAKHSAAQVENAATALQETKETMIAYGQVFAHVKTQAAELLALVDQRLKQQFATSRDGYDAIVKTANESFANAAKGLGSAVGNLTESLDTLEATIERLRTMTNGRSR